MRRLGPWRPSKIERRFTGATGAEMRGKLARLWDQIAVRLYFSFGGAAVLIIVISFFTLYVLDYIGEIQRNIGEKNIPDMVSAYEVAERTAEIVAAAPRLVTVNTREQFDTVAAEIDQQADGFRAQISSMMEKHGDDELMQRIQLYGMGIIEDVEQIKLLVKERFELRRRSLALREEIQAAQSRLITALVKEIDDQLFYAMTGYRSIHEAPAPRSAHFSEREFQTYRHLVELREMASAITQLLATALTVTDAALIEPLRERFKSVTDNAGRSLGALDDGPLRSRLSLGFSELLSIGKEEANGFDVHGRVLAVDDALSGLLDESRALGVDMVTVIGSLVDGHRLTAKRMVDEVAGVTATSATLLLFFNFLSMGGAIAIGWFLIQRHLIRRLARLSRGIRRMADGDLEIDIDVSGSDEIAQLSQALEVFRNHMQEAQRLSLVEELVDDLKESNTDLERSNEKLKQAQSQIVMQEKLAALGELTAGVAHEIKNPMNFIMNFSQLSKELLQELLEEVAKNKPGADGKDQYDPGLVEEVARDLTGNLERIHEHGVRVNRIVMDMLKMGRGSGEWQPTDINVLLNQHALLAFHSARAADPEFQLDIREDYAADVGELTVQPQSIGRVFLNLITNACYATNEKRRSLPAEAEGGAEAYHPQLRLRTRLAGDHVEVHIRDNGNGIPESAVENIFNPFFTTKPPDKGTGLGLSISGDIVRDHGGEIRVDTKEGEYTEMTIVLPLEPPEHHAKDAAGDDAPEDAEPTGEAAS